MLRWLRLGVLLIAGLSAGCSKENVEKTVPVSGTVNINGKALGDGNITFVGDPGTIPDVLPITNGTFEGYVKPGKKKVEIRAYKTVPPPPTATDTTGDFKENYIPTKYNTKSEITAEVSDSGISPNSFDVRMN